MARDRALFKFNDGSILLGDIKSALIPLEIEVEGKKFMLDKVQDSEDFYQYTEVVNVYREDLH
jgi:hypothetical protein